MTEHPVKMVQYMSNVSHVTADNDTKNAKKTRKDRTSAKTRIDANEHEMDRIGAKAGRRQLLRSNASRGSIIC